VALNPAQSATASENTISVGGYSWLTLNNASTSSRVAGSVSYVQAVPNTWTISLWAYREAKQAHNWGYLSGNANDYNAIYYNSSNFDVIGNVNAGVPTDGWHHYVLVANGVNRTAYRDGVLIGTNALGVTAGSTWYVGNSGGLYQCNALIDEYAIIGRALGAAEIRAIYESNAPIFAETSVYQFRVGNGLVWGDNEGLWMRDTAGNNVLGVSGVASKSWGGRLLNQGDFMLGSTSKGYLLYDSTASTIGITLADLTGQFLKLESALGISMRLGTAGIYEDKPSLSWYEDPAAPVASPPISIYPHKIGSEYALRINVDKPAGTTTYGHYNLVVKGNDSSATRSQSSLELFGSNSVTGSQGYLFAYKLFLGDLPGTLSGNRIELTGDIYAYNNKMPRYYGNPRRLLLRRTPSMHKSCK
jgi:hypothetical protein